MTIYPSKFPMTYFLVIDHKNVFYMPFTQKRFIYFTEINFLELRYSVSAVGYRLFQPIPITTDYSKTTIMFITASQLAALGRCK